MGEYMTTKDVAERLGCSGEQARLIMKRMPFLQFGRGRGATIRVKTVDFEAFLESNTHKADEDGFLPRATPFPSVGKSHEDIARREWHRQRRVAQNRKKG